MAGKPARPVRARTPPPEVITLPVLDDLRSSILTWVDELQKREGSAVLSKIVAAHGRLARVQGSQRHVRLAEFLQQSIVALENNQPQSARYVLLTALAALGWPNASR